jgi:hypothetical protein
METFDKDTFMREILSATNSEKLFEVKRTYSISPYCIPLSGCYSITNIIFGTYLLPPYGQILTDDERRQILEHIKKYSKKTNKVHVLTDVDDTILSSRLGGTNVSYKNHTVYPGVVSFYENLVSTGFVTLLSARPDSISKGSRVNVAERIKKPVDMLTGKIFDVLPQIIGGPIGKDFQDRRLARLARFNFTSPSVRDDVIVNERPDDLNFTHITDEDFIQNYPSLIDHLNGRDPINWYRAYKDMGTTKFESILKYVQIYPELNFIFIGDSGQGDLICAYKLYQYLENDETFPVKASFIHNIIKPKELVPYHRGRTHYFTELLMLNNPTFIQKLKERNIFVFNNYIEAAGYLSCIGVLESKTVKETIIPETIDDFENNKKQLIYIQEEQYIKYIEDDLLASVGKWNVDAKGKGKLCTKIPRIKKI